MKRDMELIRRLALAIEAAPGGYAPDRFDIVGYSDEQVGYHGHLMVQAGLAEGFDVSLTGGSAPAAMLSSLTWSGHEFCEAARDDTRWKNAMKIVKDKGGSVTVSVLTQLLTQLMKQTFGLP